MVDKKIKLKQTRNLFNALTRNDNCVFYGADRITKSRINKDKKSDYPKRKVLLCFYQEFEDENELHFNEKKQETICTTLILFVEQRKDINKSPTLHSVKAPFELWHEDIADIRFLAKSAFNPK